MGATETFMMEADLDCGSNGEKKDGRAEYCGGMNRQMERVMKEFWQKRERRVKSKHGREL